MFARQVVREQVPHVFHEKLAIPFRPVGRQGAFRGQIVTLGVAWICGAQLVAHVRGSLKAVFVQTARISVCARCLIGLVADVEFKVTLVVGPDFHVQRHDAALHKRTVASPHPLVHAAAVGRGERGKVAIVVVLEITTHGMPCCDDRVFRISGPA
jgi:hypothetical protein